MERSQPQSDERFMLRALELATRGRGSVSPNPMVGCVIVVDDRIIGEGWHQQYGGPHAEVNAVASVKDKALLPTATVYVNLEPCAHFGKTPPCADMLVREKVKRVVICNIDTNPLVGGAGIEKLKAAGIDVTTGVLEKEGRSLNKRFFTFIEKKRPYIILKWAQTADGFVARENFDSKWISGSLSRQLVHRWRSEEDAVLVGTATALHDDPQLNVRDWTGRDPVRLVIDRQMKLPTTLKLFDKHQTTIAYNTLKDEVTDPKLMFVKLEEDEFLTSLVNDLYRRKIQSVIVEGGSKVLESFIQLGLWDEVRIFSSPVTFGAGIPAPTLPGNISHSEKIGEDTLITIHR